MIKSTLPYATPTAHILWLERCETQKNDILGKRDSKMVDDYNDKAKHEDLKVLHGMGYAQ